MAQRLGAMTPAELYAKRFGSRAVGWLLFGLFTLYTLPYMVTGVKGAALTLESVTAGAVPAWLGGLGVVLVALLYTTVGGMRATAWTNVLQGVLFLTFLVVALVWILADMGGPVAAMERVREVDPSLLSRPETGLYTPAGWTSWGIAIALTVIAFPHMLVRLMAAKDERSLANVTRLYPWALILLWVPAVMIGVLGATEHLGLEGRASDRIFSLMTASHLPSLLAAFGFVAVLAAVMSTLDAQILTLGSMLTRDVLAPEEEHGHGGVRAAQAFGVVVAAATYALAQLWGASVFDIAKVAFSGYVTLVPALFLGVRWRRFTAKGAVASIVVANVVLGLGLAEMIPTGGFLPVFWALLAGCATAVAVSLLSSQGPRDRSAEAFGEGSTTESEAGAATRA
jgi:SSS family solute:Na+ symporter